MLINIDGNEGKIEKFKGEVNLLKNIDNLLNNKDKMIAPKGVGYCLVVKK